MYRLSFDFLENEHWFGGRINNGYKMPIGPTDTHTDDSLSFGDQSSPFFCSTKGRYIYSDDGFVTEFKNGKVLAKSPYHPIRLYDGFGDLKGAYQAAQKAHFPQDGIMPARAMFTGPQYCTWIEFDVRQNQKGIIDYAKSILEAGMPAGEIIIDDGWQKGFGDWNFTDKFENPKAMCNELREMGFDVILWIVPFISKNVPDFEYLKENKCLVRDWLGRPVVRNWWNGDDCVLDFSAPKAQEWFFNVTSRLVEEFGVKGFKQDAGDAYFYKKSDRTHGKVTPTQQCELWMRSGLSFRYNEFRASFKGAGVGVCQRLGDKDHQWEQANGLKSLIPHMLLLGITGHPFACPDMVGGGQIDNFRNEAYKFDNELFSRWAQASALMPMIQFSKSLWRWQDEPTRNRIINAASLHSKYADYIISLAHESAKTGEPIVKYLEYSFPNQGFEKTVDCFMLGDKYLVAPVLEKGETTRTVTLPTGTWSHNGKTHNGGETVTFDVTLDELLVLERI